MQYRQFLQQLGANAISANELTVSSEILANEIVVDGATIPAGTIAISVNISNNSGSSSYSTKLELGSAYDIIVDDNNDPIVNSGIVIGDSLIGSSCNNNVAVISTASAFETTSDGKMFTIYATKDYSDSDNDIDVYENETVVCSPAYIINGREYYRVGDMDDDSRIDATDASRVLAAINLTGTTKLYYDSVVNAPELYFPNIADVRAAFIWSPANATNYPAIESDTADEILDFYSDAAVGQPYDGDSYLGQWRVCTSTS